MPVLSNPKHERFAQELAKGKTATEAYEFVGYKDGKRNAHRLGTDEGILGRVSELLAEREKIHSQATAKAIEATALTKMVPRKYGEKTGLPAYHLSLQRGV